MPNKRPSQGPKKKQQKTKQLKAKLDNQQKQITNSKSSNSKDKDKSIGGRAARPAAQRNKTPAQKEFDTFRHEIYKLGLTGLEKKDRVSARYELAIKLGAKPKKWIKPMQGLGEQ